MVDMNRGRIQSAGTKGGHVHRLEDLANVQITNPQPGDVLVLGADGVWRNQRPVKDT